MAKKIVADGVRAGEKSVAAVLPAAGSETAAYIPVFSVHPAGAEDELWLESHHKESVLDADAPQSALAPSEPVFAMSEPAVTVAMADNGVYSDAPHVESMAFVEGAIGGGASGAVAAGETGWASLGGLALLGGVAGVGGLMIADNGKNTHDGPSPSTVEPVVHVVVDAEGAFIDTNADGIHDAGETTAAVFAAHGNADLAANSVTVHFNDVPFATGPVDLTGFTMNDKIEIDVASFHGGNAITGANLGDSHSFIYLHMNSRSSSFTVNFKAYTRSVSGPSSHHINPGLSFYTSNYSSSFQLAHWDDANNPLNHISNVLPGAHLSSGGKIAGLTHAIDELNLGAGHGVLIDFLWPAVHVIEQGGTYYIDGDRDGVLSPLEQYCSPLADFTAGGNAELASHSVVVHFHDVPTGNPLNLAGFGADDRIQLDLEAINYGNRTILASNQAVAGHLHGPLEGNTGVYVNSSGVKTHDAVFTTVNGKLQYGSVYTSGSKHYFTTSSMSGGSGPVLATNLNAAQVGHVQVVNQIDFLHTILL